jgi:antitoxin component of MazEF toxin-antitoxin module
MKTQKIIKVGNSLAITLPAYFVKEGKLKVGDELIVETAPAYQTAYIKPKKLAGKIHLTPEFFNWLNKFTKENYDLLKELAKTP